MDGVPVDIGPKALDLLTVLVEANGDLVTKAELMRRVWPGLTVEEHNVEVHISALRKALKGDAAWIVTEPKRGYRFAGPLGEADPSSAGKPPSALLPPSNRLFGREADLSTLRSLLGHRRLVTIVGPGGVGKTSLGLELARMVGGRYRDGAIFIDLSSLQDPTLVPSLIATAIGVELRGGPTPAEELVRRLKNRELLILLDNCEHLVVTVAPLVELILAGAPSIGLLATSRERIACQGEQVYRLPLLPVPAERVQSAAEALTIPSVALLVERLKAADPHFELTDAAAQAAGTICRRLDGLPLAIEMIGSLVPNLGLETMADRLEEKVSLPYSVSRTATARHRSLETVLDWSHALLSPAECVMLRRLAVFPGPFSLEAAEAVAIDELLGREQCGELLGSLVRKSLVSVDLGLAPISYRMLETVRAYAAEKLAEAEEHSALHDRHARYVAATMEKALRDWDLVDDETFIARYGWLLADLRAALRWCFVPDGDVVLGSAIAGYARPLWQMLGLVAEGRRWSETAAAALTDGTPLMIAASVWLAVGYLTMGRSAERAKTALRSAVALFARMDEAAERGTALSLLGQILASAGETKAAEDTLALARIFLSAGASKRRLGICAVSLGVFHIAKGSCRATRQEYELAKLLFTAAGATRAIIATLDNLADALWSEGDLPTAIETVHEALELARRHKQWRFVGHASGNLAGMLTAYGRLDEALLVAREAVPLSREDEFFDWLLPHLALRLAKAGRPEDAARLWGYAVHVAEIDVAEPSNERRAAETLKALLPELLPPEQLSKLLRMGQYLDEDQAVALALS
ncbi:MAG TPA: winged helix-turn-helix domain-containing protein [Aliidongia sp.]|nr:winged helix-turn-helix domain-containing protein [Aliidongia sp.]